MATRQPAPASTEGLTVIGPHLHVNGRIEGEEDLRIEGRVEGSVSLTETLYVAEGGVVAAKVAARDVVVSGVVVGNVSATNSVTLNAGAKLVGDIATPRLIISDGAAFRGNVAMDGEAPAPAVRTQAARVRPRASVLSRPAAKPVVAPPARPARKAPPAPAPAPARVAVIQASDPDQDEKTIVVRHAALEEKAKTADNKKAGKKKAKKSPPRARVPKPGKRRVGRR